MEPVRWGFLGAGFVATRALAPAVHAADGAVLAVAGARDASRADALRPARPGVDSYEAVLADDAVEAVYVSLPNDAHLPWTLAALDAGKHVLCEKPLGLSAAEVASMQRAAARADRLVVEASWYRWHPRVRLAERLLADGAVGTVRHASAGFTFAGVPEGNYRLDPARGGGALYDVGCYAASACLWAFGWAPVVDVAARATRHPGGVDLVTEAVLGFADGDAELRAGISEDGRQWLVVRGDAGEIELRDQPYTSWLGHDSELWRSDGRETERIRVPGTDPYRLMVEEVSRAVRGEPAYVVPLEQSWRTADALDRIAAASGRP